ncbi:MAG: NAD(P)H-dependent oxidoreductase, partial [Rhodobacteraceae bacterium]|nr:NAD(P)H-dependent oxidoreductase [Paracoccaceae bacterium]MCY4139035.1 NAD(P)H-dependent oxidoreductase [Paracoccaceae bacterium]
MHVLIVHCHPEPASFNAALTEVARTTLRKRGFSVEISDLYRQDFDPCERPEHYTNRGNDAVFSPLGEQRHSFETDTLPHDVRNEIARLEVADLVVFQFPVWWHGQPAILKGWFDRVFVSGGLYTSEMRYDRGYFRGRKAVCSVTVGAPETAFGRGSRGGDIEQILWSTHYSLHYMGFLVLPPFVAFGIQGHGYVYSDEDRNNRRLILYLKSWEERLKGLDRDTPLGFRGWDDWEENGSAKAVRT